jgi:hypothetical protein
LRNASSGGGARGAGAARALRSSSCQYWNEPLRRASPLTLLTFLSLARPSSALSTRATPPASPAPTVVLRFVGNARLRLSTVVDVVVVVVAGPDVYHEQKNRVTKILSASKNHYNNEKQTFDSKFLKNSKLLLRGFGVASTNLDTGLFSTVVFEEFGEHWPRNNKKCIFNLLLVVTKKKW